MANSTSSSTDGEKRPGNEYGEKRDGHIYMKKGPDGNENEKEYFDNKFDNKNENANQFDVENKNQFDVEKGNEILSSPVLQRHLLTPLLSKKVPAIPDELEKRPWPRTVKHVFSYIFFWWLIPVMKVGYKRTLENADLYALEKSMTVEDLYERFSGHLNGQLEKNRKKALKKNPNLTEEELYEAGFTKIAIPIALLKTLRVKYGLAVFCKMMFDIITSLTPLLTKTLINYVQKRTYDDTIKANKGIGYSFGVSILVLLSGMLINHFFNNSMTCGLQVKAILTKLLLDKSFRLDGKARQTFTTGKITSIMGSDLARIDLAIGFQPFLITFPVPVAIVIVLLLVNIGVSALVGIGVFLLVSMFIIVCSKKLVEFRKSATKYTDARVGLVREVLNSIKMIKYYGWEVPYHENIKERRSKEMSIIFKLQSLRVLFTALAITLPTVCSVVSFLVLHALKPHKSPGDIFSSVSLFQTLSQQVIMVPAALGTSIDAFVALQRVKELIMSSEEQPLDEAYEKEEKQRVGFVHDDSMAIQVKNAEFKWDSIQIEEDLSNSKSKINTTNGLSRVATNKSLSRTATNKSLSRIGTNTTLDIVDPSSFTGLHNITLDIKKGEFVIITGTIGAGKTSLLNAFAGFMARKSGAMEINDSLLMCGYPWVQNATVKDNILFGQAYDAERYKTVIHVCSLDADLSILPAGDMTEVGERGITLSGGQKARINLARAVYNNKNIILLDDVLSAVDARVGKHIMETCIMGFLKEKTRVLATHQLSLINYADRVIFLNDTGEITIGTVEQLKQTTPGFAKLMEFSKQVEEEDEEAVQEQEKQDMIVLENEENVLRKRRTNRTENEEDVEHEYQDKQGDGTLIKQEERAINKISWKVYKNYIYIGVGKWSVPLLLILVLEVAIGTFSQLFTNTWLSFWTEDKFHGKSSGFYIGIYVMFCVLSIVFVMVEFSTLTYLTNVCARELNIRAVRNVLYTPMSFLDTTPMGRILNRFTKDTDALDNEIGEQLRLFVLPASMVIGVLILCIIYLPWIAIAIPGLFAIYVSITSFYQASAREVKRLEAVNRSFVYNNFNECLSGVNTIKAYGLQSAFMKKSDKYINNMNEAYYINVSIQRFLAVHFDMVAVVLILIVSLLCVTRQFHISASSTGLLLSYVLQIVGLLSLLIRSMTQVENEMNSAERLIYYAYDLPQEAAYEIQDTKPSPEWPEQGRIQFDNVDLRYRDGLPLVLHDLSFDILPGEKIGICGRTGAGKSSIMTALYRLAELDKGRILIDNIDISSLGLHDLRSKLCIIPQDPVLFKGSVRKNLDPFGDSNDEKLWDALRRAGLIESAHLPTIKKQVLQDSNLESLHKFHLDQQVEEEGSNFSLGERQLLALARALVRDSRILILDEATSSVDYETDANINKTIRTEFKDCTILCIAHRLNTIVKFDRIMVLDKGSIKEFGKPIDLYNMQDGVFREMCERSQITRADFESDIA